MSNKLCLLLFCLPLVYGLQVEQDWHQLQYFEGEITFDIDYTPYSDEIDRARLKERIGSKVVLTFKEGSYKKQYFSPQGKVLSTRYLNLKDNKSYSVFSNADTIFWFDIRKADSKTTFQQLADSTVRGYDCYTIASQTMVGGTQVVDGEKVEISGLYHYGKDLSVNPEWYKAYEEGNFNEIMKVAKGIAIDFSQQGMYWDQHVRFNTITRRKVKKKEIRFKVPKNRPLKEL